MKRREFLSALGGAAVAWPLAARAQQSSIPVIGFLSIEETSPADAYWIRAFRQGLSQSGFVEGRNVIIEYHWAEGQRDRLPGMAADLVSRRVAIIVTPSSPPATLAARAATTTIPIVYSFAQDPIALGLVSGLNHPGGNVTGVTTLNTELGPKRFELLHEVSPTTTSVALLFNPKSISAESDSRSAQTVARTQGLQLHVLKASSKGDFDTAFTSFLQLRVGGLVIAPSAFFYQQSEQLAALALRHAVPTVSPYREFAAAGGLMSYGSDVGDQYRIVGTYTGRILKGEKAGDLPVQQITKIKLVINMKTARALGLTVPLSLLGRADEVIE